MSNIVYLDNAATTKMSTEVGAEIKRAEEDLFYNSAALYSASLAVSNELVRANEVIKRRLTRTGEGDLIFTSGATEGNNTVILGKITHPRQHLLVLEGEHSSVHMPAVYLQNQGFQVDFVPLDRWGTCDFTALRALVRANTALVVFGLVNSDTGCLQPAAEIIKTVRATSPKVHIHVDAVQAFCKFNFDADALGFDSCAISSHKIYGPKGVGALWVRKGVNLRPLMFGGAQQELRPGTENNPGILGFAKAVETFDTVTNFEKVKLLHNRLRAGLLKLGCGINGRNENPYITNVQLNGVLGQTVLNALSEAGVCVGLGSACAAKTAKNRTLLAMGIAEQKTKQVLRVSFGAQNTADDVDKFLGELGKILGK